MTQSSAGGGLTSSQIRVASGGAAEPGALALRGDPLAEAGRGIGSLPRDKTRAAAAGLSSRRIRMPKVVEVRGVGIRVAEIGLSPGLGLGHLSSV